MTALLRMGGSFWDALIELLRCIEFGSIRVRYVCLSSLRTQSLCRALRTNGHDLEEADILTFLLYIFTTISTQISSVYLSIPVQPSAHCSHTSTESRQLSHPFGCHLLAFRSDRDNPVPTKNNPRIRCCSEEIVSISRRIGASHWLPRLKAFRNALRPHLVQSRPRFPTAYSYLHFISCNISTTMLAIEA